MADRAPIQAIAQRLRNSAGAGHWSALSSVDVELSQLLDDWIDRGVRLANDPAWRELRRAHAEALQRCSRELAQVRERLAQMRARREACLDYLRHSDEDKE